MTPNVNLSQLTNLVSMLNSSGLSSSVFGQNSSFINSVFTSGTNIYGGYASGTADGEIQATMNVVSLLTNLLQKFVGDESAVAASDVANGQKTIAEGTAKVIEFERTGNAEIDACLERIEAELQNVQNVQVAITEKSKEVQEANTQLDAQKQIIAENVAKVNNSKDDQGTVDSSLVAIKSAGAEITNIAAGIAGMVQFIAEQEGILTESTTNIATQLEGAQEVVVKTLESINTEASTTALETIKGTTKMGVDGATNNAVATVAQTAATSSAVGSVFTFGATSGLVAKYQEISLDQFAAGATRIGGVASNMAALGSSLGTATGEMATVASYATTIGAAATKSVELVGQAGISLSAMIIAVGSWVDVPSDVETITTAVDQYKTNSDSNNGNGEGGSDSESTTTKLNIDTNNLFKKVIDSNAETTK